MSAASEKRDEPDGWWLVVQLSMRSEDHYIFYFFTTHFFYTTRVLEQNPKQPQTTQNPTTDLFLISKDEILNY